MPRPAPHRPQHRSAPLEPGVRFENRSASRLLQKTFSRVKNGFYTIMILDKVFENRSASALRDTKTRESPLKAGLAIWCPAEILSKPCCSCLETFEVSCVFVSSKTVPELPNVAVMWAVAQRCACVQSYYGNSFPLNPVIESLSSPTSVPLSVFSKLTSDHFELPSAESLETET